MSLHLSEKQNTMAPTTIDAEADAVSGHIDTIYVDPKKEGKMMRKFDICAITLLGSLYMMAVLDRSNLGNAQVAGMPQDIGLTGNQFGTATTLLFATYVPFEAPAAIILKKVGLKRLLSTCALCWGLVTLSMGFIHNWQGLYTCRLLLGFFESALIPCINVYIAMVYKKSERGKRSSMIYGFRAFASAFGGALAYGLTQITGPNGFEGWRWLFVIEGIITLLIVPIFFFAFPAEPTTAWFLTEEEKQMMQDRYKSDPSWGHDDEFSWTEILRAFTDYKFYLFAIYQFGTDISLYGFTTFMPRIVSGLGYTSYYANLMTVPIYMTALVFYLTVAFFSDKTGLRGPFLAGPMLLLITGCAMLIGAESLATRYAACFITAMGIYPVTSLSLMWLQDNAARHYKRATMTGMTLTIGNTAGVVVGQIFTTQTAPRYLPGLYAAMSFAIAAFVIVLTLMGTMHLANKRRAAKIKEAEIQGIALSPDVQKGDSDVFFKYSM